MERRLSLRPGFWLMILLFGLVGERSALAQADPGGPTADTSAAASPPADAPPPPAEPASQPASPSTVASAPLVPPLPPPLLVGPTNPAKASLWRDDWPQFRTSEGLLTLAAGATTGIIVLIGPIKNPRWKGGILFDTAVRNGIRAKSADTRQTFRTIGNWTYHLSPVLPLFDAFVVSTIGHSDSKLALNLGAVAFEAYSYTGAAAFISTETSARQRPDGSDTQSFFSGHAAIAATGAGLVCASHTRIALWGNSIADIAACVLASADALATATTRVIADRHYASDVLLGTGIGFAVGYSVPVLLHYSYSHGDRIIALGPDPTCGGDCIGVSGTF